MEQLRVTVFGGSGFVGRHLVRHLARAGHIIRVASRDPEQVKELKPAGTPGQIVPFPANMRNEDSVRFAVDGADAVVNLVGIMHESGPQSFRAVHVDGAERVARLAREGGVRRFVQMSALGADPRSESQYARTKALGEQAVAEAFPGAQAVRPSIIFGPEDSFFNRFAAMARLSPVLPLIGGGHTRFQPIYVGDLAEAFVRLVGQPVAADGPFELGGPCVYTFRELMELMLKAIRRRRMLVSVPFGVASMQGALGEMLPSPPLTSDQVALLKTDSVCSGAYPGIDALGIQPVALEAIIPTYLDRFRVGGRFHAQGV